jgi:hypothetical protein
MTAGRTPPPTRATLAGRAYLDLRAIAKKSGRANDEYLRLYALEGFLLRLAASAGSQDFVQAGDGRPFGSGRRTVGWPR